MWKGLYNSPMLHHFFWCRDILRIIQFPSKKTVNIFLIKKNAARYCKPEMSRVIKAFTYINLDIKIFLVRITHLLKKDITN